MNQLQLDYDYDLFTDYVEYKMSTGYDFLLYFIYPTYRNRVNEAHRLVYFCKRVYHGFVSGLFQNYGSEKGSPQKKSNVKMLFCVIPTSRKTSGSEVHYFLSFFPCTSLLFVPKVVFKFAENPDFCRILEIISRFFRVQVAFF